MLPVEVKLMPHRIDPELPPVPPKPASRGTLNKGYYDSHRPQIEAELKLYGLQATKARWKIAGSTWSCIRRRWGLPCGRPWPRPRIELPVGVGDDRKPNHPCTVRSTQEEGVTGTAPASTGRPAGHDGPTALVLLRLRPGDGVGGIRFTWLDADGAVIGKRDR